MCRYEEVHVGEPAELLLLSNTPDFSSYKVTLLWSVQPTLPVRFLKSDHWDAVLASKCQECWTDAALHAGFERGVSARVRGVDCQISIC